MIPKDHHHDFEAWLIETKQNQRDFDPPGRAQNRLSMLKLNSLEAAEDLKRLSSKPVKSGTKSDIARRALLHLQFCTKYGNAPPPALTDLISKLLEIKPKRDGIRNWAKFSQAARFVAENPGASPTAIKKHVRGDARQIKTWLDHPMFASAVNYWKAAKEAKV